MNLERMQLMATMLQEVIAGTWKPTAAGREGMAVEFDLGTWTTRKDCGYAACAIGHATLDERFISQGLEMLIGEPCLVKPAEVPGDDPVVIATSYRAAAHFFGISLLAAHGLFSPYAYLSLDSEAQEFEDLSPQAVLARVQSCIRHGNEEAFLKEYEAYIDTE